ncbi:hypothetical protein [Spirillospora sp. CA-294931]|uniref:hypothetical protein n=1 Tax=Spirillospora sp. CA-294931 TaxID=3240042 RepID=UPI003D8A3A70
MLGAFPLPSAAHPGARPLLRVLTGSILDASPHLLVLRTAGGEERSVPMTSATAVWHGGRGGLADLQPGREAIARLDDDGLVAERVWVDITRVTGTILDCGPESVNVDMGPHRGRVRVVIPPQALGQVLVRHPRMEPGYLIDVICVRSPAGPSAVRPGTSQPGHRADDIAASDPGTPTPVTLQGTATWFGDLAAELGAAYPALDPEGEAGGCVDAPSGCATLPYLSIGSDVAVSNECSQRSAAIPVVECGCVAARYCDRCVECGTSPRGRLVELTPAAFAGLGGDLESGCFNVKLHHGAAVGEEAERW